MIVQSRIHKKKSNLQMYFSYFIGFMQNTQRKILLLLALSRKFIEYYNRKKLIQEENQRKKHEKRRKELNLSTTSEFKTIQPVKSPNFQLDFAYDFFLKIKNQINHLFRQNFVAKIKIGTQQFDNFFSKQQVFQHHKEAGKDNLHYQSHKKIGSSTFITGFNNKQLSYPYQPIQLILVSNSPSKKNKLLKSAQSLEKDKYLGVKQKSSRSRLKIYPISNKYQSRKKQEIRLFLQLNEKTNHLQKFRSEEGKFYKLNENMKITIKNVNISRMVLLNKKNVIMQQFQRLELNNKIMKNKQLHRSRISSNNKENNDAFSLYFGNQKQEFINYDAFKQKAIRIKYYFEEASSYFSIIQSFLKEFIENDKSYENYIKQNELKFKLRNQQKITQKQKLYQNFVDQCFHMSQIARIYFNALNQINKQNISVKNINFPSKEELEKQNKILISLRYVLIYLQKECQNTTQSTFFVRPESSNLIHQAQKKQNFNLQFFYNEMPIKSNFKGKNPLKVQNGKELQQIIFTNKHIEPQITKKSSIILNNNIYNQKTPNYKPQFIAKSNQLRHKSVKKKRPPQGVYKHSRKDEELDMNEIWRQFYNKKFSSSAIRMRIH